MTPNHGTRTRGLGRAFRGLWAATAAANLGDGAVLVVLPLLVVGIGGSPGEVAAVTVAATAAWPVFALPAGWVVDSVDRRHLLTLVNAGRVLVLVGVAAAASTGRHTVFVVVGAALVLGLGEVLADTAFTALVAELVPAELRGKANTRVETTINVLNQLTGPPLAGLLLGAGVVIATASVAGLYGAALGGLALLPPRKRRHSPTPSIAKQSWRTNLTSGIRFIWSVPLLRRLALLTAAMNVVWSTWGALFVVHAVTPGPLRLSPPQYGLVLASMAVGGIAVAPAIDLGVRKLGPHTVLMLDLIGTLLLVAPIALQFGLPLVLAGVVLAGAGATVWRAVVATLRQNLTPNDIMGRVYTASRLISWGVLPVGAGLAGLTAHQYGVQAAFAAATLLAMATLVAFGLFLPRGELNTAYKTSASMDVE